jgi:hypothetical protein
MRGESLLIYGVTDTVDPSLIDGFQWRGLARRARDAKMRQGFAPSEPEVPNRGHDASKHGYSAGSLPTPVKKIRAPITMSRIDPTKLGFSIVVETDVIFAIA